MFCKLLVLFVLSVLICMQCQARISEEIIPNTLNYTLPKFKKQHYLETVRPVGDILYFNCKAEGKPIPTIKWYKNDANPIVRSKGSVEEERWSITLEDLTVGDEGSYTCRVCNVMGCINRTTTLSLLTPDMKPNITRTPKNQTVAVGEYVLLTCNASSTLETLMTWQFEPKNYDKYYEGYIFLETGNIEDNTEYKFKTNSTNDEGWYSCVYSNIMGTVEAKAYVTVIEERVN